MYLYSPSRNGFYKPEIHDTEIPDDVVEVSDEQHAELYASGMSIVASSDGTPVIAPESDPDPDLVDREAAKASALAKLEALGLTTEEAQAIAGI